MATPEPKRPRDPDDDPDVRPRGGRRSGNRTLLIVVLVLLTPIAACLFLFAVCTYAVLGGGIR